MPIPSEIKKIHVAKALQNLVKGPPDEKKKSTKYRIVISGISLEPKRIVSRASFYALGKELAATEFTGTEAKAFLDGMDFKVSLDTSK